MYKAQFNAYICTMFMDIVQNKRRLITNIVQQRALMWKVSISTSETSHRHHPRHR